MSWITLAYVIFTLQHTAFPLIFILWPDNPLWLFYVYVFVCIFTLICFSIAYKIKFKKLFELQTQVLLWYVLAGLNTFFTWNVFELDEKQNKETAFITYITLFLVIVPYTIILQNPMKTLQYVIIQANSIVRLFFYAISASQAITGEYADEAKDFYLLFMATQTAFYCLVLDQTKKHYEIQRHQEKVDSLLEGSEV